MLVYPTDFTPALLGKTRMQQLADTSISRGMNCVLKEFAFPPSLFLPSRTSAPCFLLQIYFSFAPLSHLLDRFSLCQWVSINVRHKVLDLLFLLGMSLNPPFTLPNLGPCTIVHGTCTIAFAVVLHSKCFSSPWHKGLPMPYSQDDIS